MQPIDGELFKLSLPVSICHALGHVMTNVSFAAVAVSFTHTIKDTVVMMGVLVAVVLVGNSCACLILTALEPFFNAAASQFILGQQIPLVSMASMTELSFNWKGFISAMTANVAFTYRNIYSKKAMTGMDSTNVYAYISIISLALCIPPAIVIEGPQLLQSGFGNAITKVGISMFYHLYNQKLYSLTFNFDLQPLLLADEVTGNKISTQTGIGTAIAIGGVAIYSYIKAKLEEEKRAKAATS
ncbi:unnamed protein product [Sphagnum troendelagicum]|uniref:Sugar phosphate transporter domain-containing protein n=1 Tax=Sphagnum troendelagicum TaxID=128251 RepID=A0ABP0U0G3_9BRYO